MTQDNETTRRLGNMTTRPTDNQTTEQRLADVTTRPNKKKVMRETLSAKQLSGMLMDLKAFRVRVVNEGLNMDVGIIDEDILSMEQRVADKVNEGV